MSRRLAAYFAIVGTLAFALPGAASAGQVNIPQIPRPQANIPHSNISPPRISVPTQGLSNLRMISGWKGTAPRTQTLSTATTKSGPPKVFLPPGGTIPDIVPPASPFDKSTAAGNVGAFQSSNTGWGGGSGGGGSYGGSGSGGGGSYGGAGYSTAGKANAGPSFRCRSKGGKSNCPL